MIQLVVLLLDSVYYAFYGEWIRAILLVSPITFVPGMPDYVLGVTNIRGEIESVVELRSILGLPSRPIAKRDRILLGEINGIRSGIVVDSVEDVLEAPKDKIVTPISDFPLEQREYMIGETSYNHKVLPILDLGKIFDTFLKFT